MKRGATSPRTLAAFALVLLMAGCGGSSSSQAPSPPPPAPPSEVLTITTNANVQCILTDPFSLSLQVQGNSSPVTWTILEGLLPFGLSLDPATGTISGTPTQGTGQLVTVQAADAKASTTKQFSFTVFGKLVINPVNPPPAHLNVAYSLPVVAQGSSAVASWTVVSGQVPPGLSFSVSQSSANIALISGTPTQVGNYPLTVQAQVSNSALSQTATVNLTVAVDSNLTITKVTLKDGGQNHAYSDSFAAVNGTPPIHWSASGFPQGLSVDPASGQVTGTPVVVGSFPYTVTASDSSSTAQTDSGQGTIRIAQQLQVQGTFPPAHPGQRYQESIFAFGGFTPYTWTLLSGSLPPGFTLASSGDTTYEFLLGTPSQLGDYVFVLQVTDSSSPPYVATTPVAFSVVPPRLFIPGVPLSPAPVNALYHSQIPVSGGTPPYSWGLSSGLLPPGLTLDSGTGNIDGTPTQSGTFNFVSLVTDAGNPAQTATNNNFIQIRPALGRNDSIATASPLGNSANVNVPVPSSISPYIDPINAAAPNPDTDFYRLFANGGSLVHVETFAQRTFNSPLDTVLELLDASGHRFQTCTPPAYASVCLNDDIDSTTLDSALDFQVPGPSTSQATLYVHVFDWRGDARPDMQYFLNISGVIEPLTISPSTLGPGATRGVNYQQQFSAKGGTGAATWTIAGGALPPGWSLSSSGLLSGIATTDGFYTFFVQATDAANPPQVAVTRYDLQIAEPLTITSSATWPDACLNQPYSFTVQTSGGVPPIFFGFFSSGWVPINLDTSTGTFSGMAAGSPTTLTGTVSATDSAQPFSGQSQVVTLHLVNCP